MNKNGQTRKRSCLIQAFQPYGAALFYPAGHDPSGRFMSADAAVPIPVVPSWRKACCKSTKSKMDIPMYLKASGKVILDANCYVRCLLCYDRKEHYSATRNEGPHHLKCHGTNAPIQMTQTGDETSAKAKAFLRPGRLLFIICVHLVVGLRKEKTSSKTKFCKDTTAICQNCRHKWKISVFFC